jgi:hypothetical protein
MYVSSGAGTIVVDTIVTVGAIAAGNMAPDNARS